MTVGYVVHAGAKVTCAHPPGDALPTAVSSRVLVAGQPAATIDGPWTVPGCGLPSGGRCQSATWTLGTTRTMSNGRPFVVQGGTAVCLPTGSALTVIGVQNRVRAS